MGVGRSPGARVGFAADRDEFEPGTLVLLLDEPSYRPDAERFPVGSRMVIEGDDHDVGMRLYFVKPSMESTEGTWLRRDQFRLLLPDMGDAGAVESWLAS